MHKIIVSGSGVDVGKTIVSAILTTLLKANYWKPIQCCDGELSDTNIMKELIDSTKHHIYPSAYSLKEPVSPHHAARLENISIKLENIAIPQSIPPLVIETVGGIFVPLTTKILSFELFKSWNYPWIIVSRHYIGSINHTLLTLDALKRQKVPILGLIFNGEPNPDTEEAILEFSKLPFLGRLFPEQTVNRNIIQKYANQWQPNFSKLL